MKLKSVHENPKFQSAQKKLSDLITQKASLEKKIEETRQQNMNITEKAKEFLDGRKSETATQQELCNKLDIIKKAIQIQRDEVEAISRELSSDICKQIEPESRSLAMATHKALKNMIGAMKAEADFFEVRVPSLKVNTQCWPDCWAIRPEYRKLTRHGLDNPNNPLQQVLDELETRWKLK